MKYFNYFLIVLGAIVAMCSKAGTEQNQYVLIGGIMVLMIGVYRTSRHIPSKDTDDDINKDDER